MSCVGLILKKLRAEDLILRKISKWAYQYVKHVDENKTSKKVAEAFGLHNLRTQEKSGSFS